MASLTYQGAIKALADRGRFGIRLGLGRTRALLRELGNPHEQVRGALVAGTNGKGSVLALGGAALQAAGYRVGTTPTPHLVTYRERLQIDGRSVGDTVELMVVRGGVPMEFTVRLEERPATVPAG